MQIRLCDFMDVNAFSKGIQFFDGAIDVKQGTRIGDAKSILQLYSMDLSRPIDISIVTENKDVERDFYNYVRIWSV